jgi:hypothetical protein
VLGTATGSSLGASSGRGTSTRKCVRAKSIKEGIGLNGHKKRMMIEKYNKALMELYNHVGFKPDWVVYPIDDCTGMWWSMTKTTVKYAETQKKYNSSGDYYQDDIYTQRFYRKHVYEGKDYTMIFCNTHVDGMIWFKVFDNKKRMI